MGFGPPMELLNLHISSIRSSIRSIEGPSGHRAILAWFAAAAAAVVVGRAMQRYNKRLVLRYLEDGGDGCNATNAKTEEEDTTDDKKGRRAGWDRSGKRRAGEDEAMKAIVVAELGKENNKSSAVEQDEVIQQYKRASKTNKNRTISSVHLADVAPWMEGAIILSYLTATNKSKEYIIAELQHRKVRRLKTRIRKKNKKPVTINIKEWSDMNEGELRHVVRDDERARLQKEEEKVFAKVQDIKSIKPFSEKMKQWMPRQWQIYKEKKGTG
eukprot:scaffold43611_cov30-Cyclotella_meneghiniana.AAC.1